MQNKTFLKLIVLTTFLVSFLMSILLSLPERFMVANALEANEINSKAFCLIEQNSGEVLTEKDSKKHLPIASVTKTMTLLLTFEAIEQGKFGVDDLLVCSKRANGMGGSQVFLDADAEYKVDDLLYAVVLSSANDASVVFAEAIAGTEENFVKLMNEKAKELGLSDTNFVNCTGLPANNHYSCAYDVAQIMKELTKHTIYFNYTKERLRDFVHPSGRITQMTNTNKLVRFYDGCDAGKTGSTVEAGYCLAATAKRNDMRLISVVLGAENSKQRFADCTKVFDYGFNNFELKTLVDEKQQIDFPNKIAKAKQTQILVKPQKSYYEIVKKGEENQKTANFKFFDVSAPKMKDDVVGKIYITKNNEVCDEIDIILCDNVEQKTYLDGFKEALSNW